MVADPGRVETDQSFCWEQVVKTNRIFRISHVFAPRACAEKLLPLYALFSSVEQLCGGISEEDVARSKLNWWRSECLYKAIAESSHPVLRELARTGAAQDLSADGIAHLFDSSEERLTARAPADLEELKEICLKVHRPQLELELSLSGQHEIPKFNPDWSAHCGLLQLIRESSGAGGQGRYWWLPLNLLARHGVSRDEVLSCSNKEPGGQLLHEILEAGNGWSEAQNDQSPVSAGDHPHARHYFVMADLNSRKLKQLARTSPDSYLAVLNGFRLTDLFGAWASARRFRRGSQL